MRVAQHSKRKCSLLVPVLRPVAWDLGVQSLGRTRGPWGRELQKGRRPGVEESEGGIWVLEGKASRRRGGQLDVFARMDGPPSPTRSG